MSQEIDLDKVNEFWATAATWRTPQRMHWTEHAKVQERMNLLTSGDIRTDRFQYFIRKYFPHRRHVQRVLTLGCGHGDFERGFAQYNFSSIHDAIDISQGAIEKAAAAASAAGMRHIRYAVGDLNTILLPEYAYDVIFGISSIHHVANLENLYQQVSASLKPGGYFFLDEFVGPNQFQWSDEQLEFVNQQLEIMPPQLKLRVAGLLKTPVIRPTVEQMTAGDPSEAIRSSDIIPLLPQWFDVIEVKGYGGTLLNLLLYEIVGNFKENDPASMEYLQSLFDMENEWIASGRLQHDFAIIVARKKTSVRTWIDYYTRKKQSSPSLAQPPAF